MLPQLKEIKQSKLTIDAFKGLCHKENVPIGAFYDMKNMACDDYPVLSTRGHRGLGDRLEDASGLTAGEEVYWVRNDELVYTGGSVRLPLDGVERKLVVMGAFLYVFPDKVYIDTKDFSLHHMEREYVCPEGYTMALFKVPFDFDFESCCHKGAMTVNPNLLLQTTGSTYYKLGDIGVSVKKNPASLYQCTAIKEFDENGKKVEYPATVWTEIDNYALALAVFDSDGSNVEIDGFKEGDHIELSGITGEYEPLNGMHKILKTGQRLHGTYMSTGGNYLDCSVLVIDGQVENDVYRYIGPNHYDTGPVACEGLTLARKTPDMEYITAYQNRLWGCNSAINEVYCCVLGDPTNWRSYEDMSTAAYSASVGVHGAFTGACTYNGSILFFKEDALFKIYGTRPQNFTMTTLSCRGVEKGSDKSLVTINERLYYKSRDGICIYNGDVPYLISDSLGSGLYYGAVAGTYRDKYYVSLSYGETGGDRALFVYDTVKGLWTKEDGVPVREFVNSREELYFIADGRVYSVSGVNDLTAQENVLEEEGAFKWFAETGDLYEWSADKKFISKLQLRMEVCGALNVELAQDGEEWEKVYRVTAQEKRTVFIPIIPKRCDYLRLRLSGQGDFKLYTIGLTMEKGSEL